VACGNCNSKEHTTKVCPVQKCNYEARGGSSRCSYGFKCAFKAFHSEKQKALDRSAQAKAQAAVAAAGSSAQAAGGAKK
jgi:hypothetical protein